MNTAVTIITGMVGLGCLAVIIITVICLRHLKDMKKVSQRLEQELRGRAYLKDWGPPQEKP